MTERLRTMTETVEDHPHTDDQLGDLLSRIAYVTALDCPPDAILAVKCSVRLSPETAQTIKAQVEEALPGRKVLVLSPELDLVVLR